MSTRDDPKQPVRVPRIVRPVRWLPIAYVGIAIAILLLFTFVGLLIVYEAIGMMALHSTGLKLPGVRDHEDAALPFLALIAGTVSTALMSAFWLPIWKNSTELKLIIWGTATVGRITGKRTASTEENVRGPEYEFDFAHPYGATSMKVNADCFDRFAVGDTVTVLYDPSSPDKSIIYDWTFVFAIRNSGASIVDRKSDTP